MYFGSYDGANVTVTPDNKGMFILRRQKAGTACDSELLRWRASNYLPVLSDYVTTVSNVNEKICTSSIVVINIF